MFRQTCQSPSVDEGSGIAEIAIFDFKVKIRDLSRNMYTRRKSWGIQLKEKNSTLLNDVTSPMTANKIYLYPGKPRSLERNDR
ncbi:hypothetical protein PoB_007353600 [Plakobranchus ocellatus]|uniref:Uncharacterized protein n=1 Tax=Plakobranchus ocellatus TaxID=259542 RepID=A0AAV4DSG7_9GAST|nr:hypothetical protein PoB_007353600 [Plakobranchus ocellatus]